MFFSCDFSRSIHSESGLGGTNGRGTAVVLGGLGLGRGRLLVVNRLLDRFDWLLVLNEWLLLVVVDSRNFVSSLVVSSLVVSRRFVDLFDAFEHLGLLMLSSWLLVVDTLGDALDHLIDGAFDQVMTSRLVVNNLLVVLLDFNRARNLLMVLTSLVVKDMVEDAGTSVMSISLVMLVASMVFLRTSRVSSILVMFLGSSVTLVASMVLLGTRVGGSLVLFD
jgi:hypothetical protein